MIKTKKKEVLVYTALFIMFLAFLFTVFACRGRSFIHTGDPFDQDYPIFLYLGKYLQGILNGEGIRLYDFSIGLGENVIAPLNLYGFGDPLNLLSVFVTPGNGEFIYTFLLSVRLYLVGLGMLVFLKDHGHQGLLAVGGALLYAFSLFSICRGLHFYSLLNAMYLFPFLLIQLERLISQKRRSAAAAKFALLIAVQICCSFYFLYMQSIFLVIYGLLYYFEIYGKKPGWRHLVGKIVQVGGCYLLGVLTSGAILFSTLYEFFHSSRTAGGLAQKSRLLFSLKELFRGFCNLLIPMISDDNYGLGIPFLCLMAVVVSLLGGKKLKNKAIICGLAAAYICPFFWSVTNGFSYESDRWTYVLYFGLAYLTVLVLEEGVKNPLPPRHVIFAALLALLSVTCHLLVNGDKLRSAAYLLAILICAAALMKFKLREGHLLALLSGCIWLNLFFLAGPWQLCGHDIWQSFCDKKEIEALSAKMFGENQGEGFERIDVRALSRADSLVAGYKGTTEYFSILNENTFLFWEELLISPGICAEPHHLEGLDGRAPLEALLSVSRYQNGNQIYENENMLPLGVQYTQAISHDKFLELSPLQRQHVLLEKVVLEEGADEVTDAGFKPITLEFEAEWKNIERKGDSFYPGSDARMILKTDEEAIKGRLGELYVYFEDFQCFRDDFAAINAGEHEFLVQNTESKYYTGLNDYLVHVIPAKDGSIVISFPEGNEYELKDMAVFWYDYEGMEEAVEALKENSLQNLSLENDRISGEIEAQNGWLFFGIPYNSCWRAYVDGSQVPIQRANAGFMAVYLEEGNHHIELVYKSLWFYLGVICTAAGLIICACLFYRSKRHIGSIDDNA